MKLSVMISSVPEPEKYKDKPNLLRKVRKCCNEIEECDHPEEQKKSWQFLRRLQNKLTRMKKRSPAQQLLLEEMRPTIEKFYKLDPKGVEYDPTVYSKSEDEDA